MAKKKAAAKSAVPVDAHKHIADKRPNIPTRETAAFAADEEGPQPFVVHRDPSLDPQLVWKGKDEQDAKPLEVPAVAIHVQEKIHPLAIVEDVKRRAASREATGSRQLDLFADFNGLDDFPYKPVIDIWDDTRTSGFGDPKVYVVQTNTKVIERCILMTTDPGDLVLDPTCVRKGTRVLVERQEPPLIPPQAGGDQRLPAGGVDPAPSPLAGRAGVGLIPIEHLRLGDQVFSHDQQPHRVLRTLQRRYVGTMIALGTEHGATLVLTPEHLVLTTRRVSQLTPKGEWSGIPANHVERARQLRKEGSPPERLLWAKLRGQQLGVKFRRQHQLGPYIADFYSRDVGLVVEIDGETHFTPEALQYDRQRETWMANLGLTVRRFSASDVGGNLDGVLEAIWDESRQQVLRDFPRKQWMRADRLRVGDTVFTGMEQRPATLTIVARCEADETVFDLEIKDAHSFVTETCTVHNCGSGTTAYVAEQWGRRWITIDTSRVALALARTRLMAARFPYYLLADSPAGRKKQRELGEVLIPEDPTPTLPASGEGASGVIPASGEGASGVIPASSKPASFLPPLAGGSRGVFSLDLHKGFVYRTVPHVTLKSIANNPDIKEGMTRDQLRVLPVRMNPDMAMFGDATGQDLLKKTGTGNLFTVFGEPDVELATKDGKVMVTIKGVDLFDPSTGAVRTGDTDDIACWFIDTDYDGQSFFVRYAYFLYGGKDTKDGPYDKLKKALRAEIDEGEWSKLYSATSQPFDPPTSGKIAVKVINHFGDEVMKVYSV